ncbi:MAG: bifunctional riboflavin kinase/FAD synthetase [Desulfatibacillaceae bacterium]
MRLIENPEDIAQPFHHAVITIGNFDGVHIGHQALFHEVIERAENRGGTSMAMTFHPHPLRFLKKENRPPLITLHEQKVELISKTGIDVLVVVPFDREFASMGARDFVEKLLLERLGVKTVVVGPDYSFGKAREGTVEYLRELAAELDFEVVVVPWIAAVGPDGERISSTRVRDVVGRGDVEYAKRLLGRNYQIRGVVEHGRDRGGKLLGFPTANIRLQDELCPMGGVYAVIIEWRGGMYPGVANIGYSPTFDDHQFTVEVHLIDFGRDLYGEKIKVNFVRRLRGEVKFDGLDALKEQINADVRQARELLKI